jgi:hypothetical protein
VRGGGGRGGGGSISAYVIIASLACSLTLTHTHTYPHTHPHTHTQEFEANKTELLSTFGSTLMTDQEGSRFANEKSPWSHVYKVPFEQVLDLVAQRYDVCVCACAYVRVCVRV